MNYIIYTYIAEDDTRCEQISNIYFTNQGHEYSVFLIFLLFLIKIQHVSLLRIQNQHLIKSKQYVHKIVMYKKHVQKNGLKPLKMKCTETNLRK